MQVRAKVNVKYKETFYNKGDLLDMHVNADPELFEEVVKQEEVVNEVVKPKLTKKKLAK